MKRMLCAAFALVVLAPPADAAPHHIMSLKVCTDELLMDLVPPERIASVSYLSREKAALKIWPEAAHIPVNRNSLEEILAEKPGLVITLPPVPGQERRILEESGVTLLEIPEAENFDQIRAITRQLGDAVGESAKAESLIAAMDEKLNRLERAPGPAIRVAGWGSSGTLPGRHSLFDAVVGAAGGQTVTGENYYDVESLVAARPDVLASGDGYAGVPSLRQEQAGNPVLARLFAGRRVAYSSALLGCGVPQTVDAALALRAAFETAMRHPGGAP